MRKIENKNDRAIQIITEDINSFGMKFNDRLDKMDHEVDRRIEKANGTDQYAKLLNDSIGAIEDEINDNIISQITNLKKKFDELEKN